MGDTRGLVMEFNNTGSGLKADARKLIFENSPRLFLIVFIYLLIATITAWLSVRLPGTINISDINSRLASGEMPGLGIIYTGFRPAGVVLALLLLLLQPVIDAGFVSYCMKIRRKENTEIKDLLNGFLFFIKVLSIFLLTTLFILLWSILLIIPGIIAAYRYRQAIYILFDDPNKGALQCINESKILMNGKKLELLVIDISFLGWYVIDYTVFILMPLPVAFPVISLWLSPYVGLTRAGFYENLVKDTAF